MEEANNIFMSDGIDQITAALSAFQGEVKQPELNKENPYFKKRYVDLSGVLKAVQPVLSKHGLCVVQIINGNDLITLLSHKSGQWFKSSYPIGGYKNQQDRGGAITYMKRYAICAILGVAADTDDDGNSTIDADKDILLKQAISELNAVTTVEGFNAVWDKWKNICPEICNNGTKFYNKACAKLQEVKNAG